MPHPKESAPGVRVVGLRTQSHGDTIEELKLTHENMNEVFELMRGAVMAEVTDANGHTRTVVCREVAGAKSILLLEPLNDRATAETLTLRSFASRYKRVVVSHNTKSQG